MTRISTPALLVMIAALFGACNREPAARTQRPKPGFHPPANIVSEDEVPAVSESSGRREAPTATTEPTAPVDRTPPPEPPAAHVSNPEYGKPVPGKPGLVTSPYAPASGYIDVRGYPPGAEVKDPYTGKILLVP